ncbi:MAG: serine/threonine-protein kinase, partial [Victivallales bacterium]|nr:serine/threonine-protein kinase [Victivallales bacterium]
MTPEPPEATLTADLTAALSSGDEFISFDEIRRLIGADEPVASLKEFTGIRSLGSGGLGTVHAASERVLKREIAIKVLRPSFRCRRRPVGRIVREAIVTAQIEHPNIVPVHAMGVLDDVGVYFTMKKVSGETLQQVLEKLAADDRGYRERYPASRLLEIFISVCQGMAYAHSKGVIHRDLKPSNIMLGEYGEVMVMDWGLVKFEGEVEVADKFGVYSETHGEKMLTLDGTIAGTPLFMSPEQAAGRAAEVDQRSDVYGLGVILYDILTYRQSPFRDDDSVNDILRRVVRGDFPPPCKAASHHVPRELEAICLKAMQRDRAQRYATVLDLVKDIRCYIEGYPVGAYRAPLYYRFRRFCGRNRVVTSTVLVAMLTLIAYFSVSSLYDHLEYVSYLKAAELNAESADQARMQAYMLFRNLRSSENRGSVMGKTVSERRQESRLKLYKGMFENRYNMALFFYSKIEKMRSDDANVRKGISDIFKKLLEYALLTKNNDDMAKIDELIRMRVRNLNYLDDDARAVYFRAKLRLNNRGMLQLQWHGGGEVELFKASSQGGGTVAVRRGTSPLQEDNLLGGTYLAVLRNPEGQLVR